MIDDKIKDIAEENSANFVSLIRSLVKASREGEGEVQKMVRNKFSEYGCKVEVYRLHPIELSPEKEFAAEEVIEKRRHISVLGKHSGSRSGRSLMFFAHPDSEEIRDLDDWDHDPFKAEVEEGRMYGWGVADDLLGVATMIGVLAIINNLNTELHGEIYFCSTPSKRNARGVLSILNQGYKADAAIYLHPAESGKGLGEIKAFASGILKMKIRIKGDPPNTSEPSHTAFAHLGVNPIQKAMKIVEALNKFDDERGNRVSHWMLEEAVGRSTNLLISSMTCGETESFTRMPHECTMGVSVTFPPTEDMNEVKKDIEKIIKEETEKDLWLRENPPDVEWIFGTQGVEIPPDHSIYKVTSKAIFEVTGKKPSVNPLHSASDIRNPKLFSDIPTIGFGSLAGNLVQSGGHDEWIDINSYLDAIKVCAKIIYNWCTKNK
jgi:acetylornithine deacetylase